MIYEGLLYKGYYYTKTQIHYSDFQGLFKPRFFLVRGLISELRTVSLCLLSSEILLSLCASQQSLLLLADDIPIESMPIDLTTVCLS